MTMQVSVIILLTGLKGSRKQQEGTSDTDKRERKRALRTNNTNRKKKFLGHNVRSDRWSTGVKIKKNP